ncbi:MAG: hypothetical protein ACI8PB_002608 [Desulforhopalus sp.]|jgi:hypothetical protein
MKGKFFLLILLVLFGLTSCSSVPKPITREFTHQKTLEASEHWGVLAQDFAAQIAAIMQATPLTLTTSDGAAPTYMNEDNSPVTGDGAIVELPFIYLQTNDVSDFGKTFRNYLITELTKLGYPIAYTPEGALLARWSVGKIYHDADRTASGFAATGTSAALIGYGIYKIVEDTSSLFPLALAAGVVYDLNNSSPGYLFPNKIPHTEIVLTFTVSKHEIILSRQTQAYYVNAEDFGHYNNIADYAGQESTLKPVRFTLTN